MNGDQDPRWSAAIEVLDLLQGGSHRSAEVIRDGLSLLVRRGDLVVRTRPSRERSTAEREVAVARALAAAGVPAIALAEGPPQPFESHGLVTTAWRWVESAPEAEPVSTGTLGELASVLDRRTTTVAHTLVPIDPLGAASGALDQVEVQDRQVQRVRDRLLELTPPWNRLLADKSGGHVLVHGDLHRDNVVPGPQGPLLADLELAGSGPRNYDAVPTVVAGRRYDLAEEEVARFLDAFGRDPRGTEAFELEIAVYEAWVTAWAVGVRDRSAAWAEEATRRVACLDTEDNCAPWRLL